MSGVADPSAGSVSVDKATRADCWALVEINRLCLSEHYAIGTWQQLVDQGHSLVARCQGRVVGYLLSQCVGKMANIASFAVLPQYRGLGIGTKLLQAYLDKGRACRWLLVTLQVREDNDGARKLYSRLGFRFLKTMPRYYSDGGTGLTMARSL